MSFGSISCSDCHFGFSKMPVFYRISDDQRIMVQTYPCGEREYSKVYKKPPHESLFINRVLDIVDDSGKQLFISPSISTMICNKYAAVEYRGTSNSFNCEQCENGMCHSWDTYLDKPCPKCHKGTVIERSHYPRIEF